MSWKKWPYWVRGGVIGGGIALLSAGLTDLCEYLVVVPGYTGLGLECLPFAAPWVPFWFLGNTTSLSTTVYTAVGVVIWFIFGSFIGQLVGIIKKKKSPLA